MSELLSKTDVTYFVGLTILEAQILVEDGKKLIDEISDKYVGERVPDEYGSLAVILAEIKKTLDNVHIAQSQMKNNS